MDVELEPWPLVLVLVDGYDPERAVTVLEVVQEFDEGELRAAIAIRAWVVSRELDLN